MTELLSNAYYIVGTGESTTTGILDSNFDTFDTNAGDGTVPMWSATVGGTLPSSRVFYKYSGNYMSALHTPMVSGRYNTNWGTQDDFSTINFIVEILTGGALMMNESTLNTYGITKNAPQVNSLGWIEGVNDEQIVLSLDGPQSVRIWDSEGQILYDKNPQAGNVSVNAHDHKQTIQITGNCQITIESLNEELPEVSCYKAGIETNGELLHIQDDLYKIVLNEE